MDASRDQGMDTTVMITIVVAICCCSVCGILRIAWTSHSTRVQPVCVAPPDLSHPQPQHMLLGRTVANECHPKAAEVKSHNSGKTRAVKVQGMYKDPATQWIMKVSREGDKVWAGTPGGVGVGVLARNTLTMQFNGNGVLISGQVTSDCIQWHNGQVWEKIHDEAKAKGHLSGKYTDSATQRTIKVSQKGGAVKAKSADGNAMGSVAGSSIIMTFNGVTVRGRVSPDLSVIQWVNGLVWTKQAPDDSSSSSSDESQHVQWQQVQTDQSIV